MVGRGWRAEGEASAHVEYSGFLCEVDGGFVATLVPISGVTVVCSLTGVWAVRRPGDVKEPGAADGGCTVDDRAAAGAVSEALVIDEVGSSLAMVPGDVQAEGR